MTVIASDVRALTVKQPWAWAIATGSKTVENRSRNTHHRGPILIHAGKGFDTVRAFNDPRIMALAKAHVTAANGDAGDPAHLLPYLVPEGHWMGYFIATADLVGCHPEIEGCCVKQWGDRGSGTRPVWHWEIANAKPMTPLAARGALGLWRPQLTDLMSTGIPPATSTTEQEGTA